MAKGYDKHLLRQTMVSSLGKELSRRAKSKCELCGTQTSLKVMELPPLPEEPDPEHALLLCASCQPFLDEKSKFKNIHALQFLHDAVWSEVPPAQILVVRITKKLAMLGENWAQNILENLYLDPTIEERI